MSRLGLSGKSFIPLLSSFACAIPGVMAARDRKPSRPAHDDLRRTLDELPTRYWLNAATVASGSQLSKSRFDFSPA